MKKLWYRNERLKTLILSLKDAQIIERSLLTKISANWVELRRVSWILLDFTFEARHLFTDDTFTVQISRIKPYVDSIAGNIY